MKIITMLEEAMHTIGQHLLVPVIILMVLLMIVTLAKLGGFIVEALVERRKFAADITKLLKDINRQEIEDAKELIENSGLLRRQRNALLELLANRTMSKASLTTLAERLLADEETRYLKSLEIPEMICKLGPMFGLMGTLIPLGPGLEALAKGDVAALSRSLTIAFDATICGLACAGTGYIMVIIRRRWYNQYISQLESIMESLLEKAYPESPEVRSGKAADRIYETVELKGVGANA